jgi:hypothetical protein
MRAKLASPNQYKFTKSEDNLVLKPEKSAKTKLNKIP